MPDRVEFRLPDLDLGETAVTACSWHAAVGQRVVEGDRLLEVLAGEVTVDLPSPATGVLAERCVEIDERLAVGQLLGVVVGPASRLPYSVKAGETPAPREA